MAASFAALAAFALDVGLTTLVVNHHKLSPVVAAGVTALVVGVVALDLRVPVFGAVVADEPNAAYTAIRGDGRLLELPVFRPDIHFGSVYLGYTQQSPRERPQGYSTLARPAADRLARELRGLSCGRGEIPRELGIRFVAVHRGLYEQSGFFGAACADGAEEMLRATGWRLLARDGPIASYVRQSDVRAAAAGGKAMRHDGEVRTPDVVGDGRQHVVPDRGEASAQLRHPGGTRHEPEMKVLASVAPPTDVDATDPPDGVDRSLDTHEQRPELCLECRRKPVEVAVLARVEDHDHG